MAPRGAWGLLMPIPDPPVPQGPAPLLNRAWPRRGWASPPTFGRSVPGLMMETTVLIERRALVPNQFGGFRGDGGWVTIYNGPCHAEIVEGRPRLGQGATTDTLGVTNYRHYELFVPVPDDPAQMPKRDDRLTFADGYQVRVHPVMHIEMGSGLTDSLMLQTDEFEA